MKRRGRYLAIIELTKGDDYIVKNSDLLDKLIEQNIYLGLDHGYFIEERAIDETLIGVTHLNITQVLNY